MTGGEEWTARLFNGIKQRSGGEISLDRSSVSCATGCSTRMYRSSTTVVVAVRTLNF